MYHGVLLAVLVCTHAVITPVIIVCASNVKFIPYSPLLPPTQVQQHLDSFEEYGNRLASVLQDAVREHFMAAAAAAAAAAEPAGPAPSSASWGLDRPAEGTMRLRVTGAAASGAAAAEPLLHTAVIRGCVQAVLWGWVPEGALAEGDAAAAQRLLQRLAGRLGDPGLTGNEAGGMRGVSVQVGQAVAVAQGAGGLAHEGEDERGDQEEAQAARGEAAYPHWLSSCYAARLLKMDPPAASLPAAEAAASGPLTVRLLLHSPAPQPARVLVLAERQGAGGTVPPRAVLLREVAVALEGGVQEVEVEVGAGEVAEAGEGGEPPLGIGVLRVMLVGPVHGSQGAESEQQQGPMPPPPVHWVAPPLLLLPGEAAGELCGLWEHMKREQEEEREQGQEHGQEQPTPATPDGLLHHAVAPTGPVAALAGVEQESSLWWSHMAPLMGDLAYALTDGAGQGAEREEVLPHLLPFLHDTGMQHTAAMLQSQTEAGPCRNTCKGAPHPLFHEGAAPLQLFKGALPPGPDWTRLAAPCAGFPSRRGFLTRAQQLLPLPSIAPFSPPALELSYQAWRLAGLAATAPYVLLATAQPFLLILCSTAAQQGMQQAMGMAPLAVLNWVSESACRIMLLRLAALRIGGRRGGTVALPPASESAVAAAVRRYTLTAVVLGPSVAIAASLAVALGLLPHFDNYVGNQRAVLIACLHRSLLLPSLQRVPLRHVLAASPLLAAGEALQLAALQPTWGWRRVAGHVAAWRLVAAMVSAGWEGRSSEAEVCGAGGAAASGGGRSW